MIELFEAILATPGYVGFDFETTKDRIPETCTAQAKHEDGREAVVHCYRQPELLARVSRAISTSPAQLVAHFAVFDYRQCLLLGVEPPRGMICTYVGARALDGGMYPDGAEPAWSLKALADRKLGMILDKEVRERDWREPLDAAAVNYALDDCRAALRLWLEDQLPRLRADPDSEQGFHVVNDAIPAIATCNLHGLTFDREAHKKLCTNLRVQADLRWLEMELYSPVENHGSTHQVSAWIAEQIMGEPSSALAASLFLEQEGGIRWPTTDKTGNFILDKNVVARILPDLSEVLPDVADYLVARAAYQKAAKVLQAFGPNLWDKVDEDGRLRGTFKPHGAKTSRQSSSDPNLQNLPADEEFRACFIAPVKKKLRRKLIIADYSQIELRVGCIIADDKVMQQVFIDGRDIHSATFEHIRSLLEGRPVTYNPDLPWHKKGRKGYKGVTFASLYGAMAATIALNAGISYEEAERLLNAWLGVYTGIDRYREEQPQRAREAGYVQLVSGQKIAVLERSSAPQLINAPVQGSAASVMYRALTRVYRALKESGLDAFLCANIHDEIIIEASEEDAAAAGRILEREMAGAMIDLYPEAERMGLANIAGAAVCDRWSEKDDDDKSLKAWIEKRVAA